MDVFDSLGRQIARRPRVWVLTWAVLTGVLVTLTMTGLGGPGLFQQLHAGEPTVPGSESTTARELLDEHSPTGSDLHLVVLGADLGYPGGLADAGRASRTLHSRILGLEG